MKVLLASTIVGWALWQSSAQAQQSATEPEAQPGRAATRQAVDQQAHQARTGRRDTSEATGMDQLFAQMLAIDNAAEIRVSQDAAARLQDAQVKRFAKQMIQEHQQMLGELVQFGAQEVQLGNSPGRLGAERTPTATNTAPGAGGRQRSDGEQPGGQRGQQTAGQNSGSAQTSDADVGGSRRGAGPSTTVGDPSNTQFVRIKQEIAEQCVRSASEELAVKSGREADRCYIAAQVFGHQKMLDTLTVLQRHASPEFAQTLTKATETTRQHLDHAKQLLQSLEGQVPATGNRSGSESSQSRPPANR